MPVSHAHSFSLAPPPTTATLLFAYDFRIRYVLTTMTAGTGSTKLAALHAYLN
jgi:hypothetical protein